MDRQDGALMDEGPREVVIWSYYETMKQKEGLDRLVEGRTALIVAHRFSSIRVATRILVFEDGRIVGDGTHEQLYASCPLYRELYDRQSL